MRKAIVIGASSGIGRELSRIMAREGFKVGLVARREALLKEIKNEFPNEPVPLHLRNAPTKLMKNLGYAKDYKWGEKYVGPKENLPFLPKKLVGRKFYEKENKQ